MKSAVGVFLNHGDARRAIVQLAGIGIPADRINLLTPTSSPAEIDRVPTTDAESPGVGPALGAVVGAAVASSVGIPLATSTMLVPGAGPILALGVAGCVLLGAMAGGAAVGEKLDESLSQGLPVDELHVYEDALRKGRSVVVVLADDHKQADQAGDLMMETGAESLDAARERWWTGLRDADAEHYEAPVDEGFQRDDPVFRRGFEAALLARTRDRSWSEAEEFLREVFSDDHENPAFRRGFEQGRIYRQAFRAKAESPR